MAAARGIAAIVADAELREEYIIPSVFNRDVADSVAAAVADEAKRQGTAEAGDGRDRLRRRGRREAARRAMNPPAPDGRTHRMTRVTLTGATGLLGTRLVRALRERGDEVTVLSRDPEQARRGARRRRRGRTRWDPGAGPAPAEALAGRDAVVHLAGENVAQRWSDDVQAPHPRLARAGHAQPRRGPARRRAAPRRARELLRRRLLRPARRRGAARGHPARRRLPRARVRRLGARGAGRRGARACASCACAPASCSTRTAARWARCCRSSRPASAARSPAARQLMPWVHADDVAGIYLRAIDDAAWSGAVNATAPEPVTNKDVLEGARPRAAPPRARPRPGVRDPAPLRRHVRDRHQGPERRAAAHARARLPPRAPRPRRGAALRPAVRLTAR